jgi:ribosomal-protein-alanine N-acetyltransferase
MTIERMTTADIRAVMRIEALSFTTSWPSSAFSSELNDNKLAYYFVGRVPGGDIVAYGGIWVIVDDSHITTIAVHPDWRGKKYGEEMLVHLLHEATDRGASWITLEARESNDVAQKLGSRRSNANCDRRSATAETVERTAERRMRVRCGASRDARRDRPALPLRPYRAGRTARGSAGAAPP